MKTSNRQLEKRVNVYWKRVNAYWNSEQEQWPGRDILCHIRPHVLMAYRWVRLVYTFNPEWLK
jgi:hypothetical protein